MVDEYEGGTLEGETACESTGPLTLGELYDFLTSTWPFHAVLDMRFQGDTERLLDFFVAESDFYPQLDALCRVRVLEAFPIVAEESE